MLQTEWLFMAGYESLAGCIGLQVLAGGLSDGGGGADGVLRGRTGDGHA